MNRNEKALIKKDFNEITSSKQVILLNNYIMFAAGAVLLIIDYILMKRISSKFIPEKLV